MDIIQVEIINKNAITILKGMEKALMVRLIKRNKKRRTDISALKGVFSPEQASGLTRKIERSREEWNERTI